MRTQVREPGGEHGHKAQTTYHANSENHLARASVLLRGRLLRLRGEAVTVDPRFCRGDDGPATACCNCAMAIECEDSACGSTTEGF